MHTRALKTCQLEPIIFKLPGSRRQLGVEDANGNAELFKVELHFVAAVNVVHEDDGLATDQLQLEQGVNENKLVLLLKPVSKMQNLVLRD